MIYYYLMSLLFKYIHEKNTNVKRTIINFDISNEIKSKSALYGNAANFLHKTKDIWDNVVPRSNHLIQKSRSLLRRIKRGGMDERRELCCRGT